MLRKFFQFPLVRILVGFVLLLVVYGFGGSLVQLTAGTPWVSLLIAVAASVAGMALYYAFARWYEGRHPVAELAAPPAARELALGLAWGAGLFTLTFALLLLFGAYSLTGTGTLAGTVLIMAIAVISGFVEELIFRGVLYRILQEWLGTWVALAISAVLFGAVHLGNPNASLIAGLAIALEAGVLLALAYQATGRLWLPIGLHLAWNFTQGGIFGVPVSGNNLEQLVGGGLLTSAWRGPDWLSGGSFGAEASIVAMVVCLAGAAYFWRKIVREGKVVAPFWVKRLAAGIPAEATPR